MKTHTRLKNALAILIAGACITPATLFAQFIYPVSGTVPSGGQFGACRDGCSRTHAGLDISGSTGTLVGAGYAGTASFVGVSCGLSCGYGRLVILNHPSGYQTYYAHLDSFVISNGQSVSKNQDIARRGNTGGSTGPHVHYEIRRDGTPLFIPGTAGQSITRNAAIPYSYPGLASGAKPGPSMFYDLGGGAMNIYRWNSTGSAFALQTTTGISGGYSLSQVGNHMVAADVNGDGKTDNVVAYQYPNGTMRLHVFLNGSWYQGATGWFQSGAFSMANVGGRMVGGDFNGDGKGDVAMLYSNGGGLTIYRFISTGSSFTYDSTVVATSGYSLANVGENVAATDVNGDGRTDIVAAYQYPDGTMRLHVFLNGNSYQGPTGWYQTGTFNMANVAGRMAGGDFNGDGKGGVVMFYDLGNGAMNIYRWNSTGSSFSLLTTTGIASGYSLSQVGSRLATGDINGDGVTDAVVAYQYPDGTMRFHTFLNGSWYQGPTGWYQTGQFNLSNVGGRLTMGAW